MRTAVVTVGTLLALMAALFLRIPAYGNPETEADLLSRIKKLEDRVAQLEETIKTLQSSTEPPRTKTEAKLIGTWMAVDADRKIVSFPEMKFKGNGTCVVVWNPRPAETNASLREVQLDAKYEVIGTQLAIEHRNRGGGVGANYRIVSITDHELVWSWEHEGKSSTARYSRVK